MNSKPSNPPDRSIIQKLKAWNLKKEYRKHFEASAFRLHTRITRPLPVHIWSQHSAGVGTSHCHNSPLRRQPSCPIVIGILTPFPPGLSTLNMASLQILQPLFSNAIDNLRQVKLQHNYNIRHYTQGYLEFNPLFAHPTPALRPQLNISNNESKTSLQKKRERIEKGRRQRAETKRGQKEGE
jgi:hypothetical protein